jgi:hypothetical protein
MKPAIAGEQAIGHQGVQVRVKIEILQGLLAGRRTDGSS